MKNSDNPDRNRARNAKSGKLSESSDNVDGSYAAEGSRPAEGSLSAEGSRPAEGSLSAEGSHPEGDDFLSEMADVKPLKASQRVSLNKRPSRDAAAELRRDAAVTLAGDNNPLADDGVAPLDPWYVLAFKRPGIQNGVYRKLKQGRYAAEARLDLHRMSVKRARAEIFGFINECHELGLRSVLIVHGKGDRSPSESAIGVLKGYVDHWLRDLGPVQAFHSAQPAHGGTGAVYVLLAKSEEKKRENRERFMRGRSL